MITARGVYVGRYRGTREYTNTRSRTRLYAARDKIVEHRRGTSVQPELRGARASCALSNGVNGGIRCVTRRLVWRGSAQRRSRPRMTGKTTRVDPGIFSCETREKSRPHSVAAASACKRSARMASVSIMADLQRCIYNGFAYCTDIRVGGRFFF